MKKILALVLSLVMALPLFASCETEEIADVLNSYASQIDAEGSSEPQESSSSYGSEQAQTPKVDDVQPLDTAEIGNIEINVTKRSVSVPLYINGSLADTYDARVCDGEAELPLVAVLEELGYYVSWKNNTTAQISVNGIYYVLDIKNQSFTRENSDGYELIIPAPGSENFHCHTLEKELLVQKSTLWYILRLMNYESCNISYSADSNKITVDTASEVKSGNGLVLALSADKTSYTVIGFDYYSGKKGGEIRELAIPSFCNGLPVTAISASAFLGNSRYNYFYYDYDNYDMIFGDDYEYPEIIEIGEEQPEISSSEKSESLVVAATGRGGKIKIRSISIPSTVKIIEEGALNISTLEKIEVNESNPCFKSVDGLLYTKDAKNLIICPRAADVKELYIPDGVETVNSSAFYGCKNIAIVHLPNSVKEIGEKSFAECINLVSINVPEGIEIIGDKAFYNCSKLYEILNTSEIELVAGSSEYGEIAKYALKIRTSEDDVGILEWREDGFWFLLENGVYKLVGYNGKETKITLPSDEKYGKYEIYPYAFKNNVKIESVTIPENVSKIGDGAFCGCSSLSKLEMGDGAGIPNLHPLKNNGVL